MTKRFGFSFGVLVMGTALQSASAVVLFSDSFLVNPPGNGGQNTFDLNQNLAGREGGTMGTGG